MVKLGDVLRFFNGKSIRANPTGPFPVYGSNGTIGKCDSSLYDDAVILGRVGAYCGSVARAKGAFWASDNTIVCKACDDVADTDFCYYLLKILNLNNYAGGTAQPLITQGIIKQIEIPLPPLPIQRRIADILSAYDDLIENNRRRIAILEETARLAYRKWFGGTTADTAPLGEIADVVMGQSPESKTYNAEGEGVPFHQGVTGFGFRYPSNEMWCTAGTRFAEEGDILFSVRAPVGRINVSSEKIVIGRGLSAMRAKNGCQSWLLYTLKQYFSKEDMIGVGCIFAATTKKELLSVRLPYPQKDEILDFERYISPMDSQIKALTKQSSNLAATRDMLLPRLMHNKMEN